jgi:hypothetical protein
MKLVLDEWKTLQSVPGADGDGAYNIVDPQFLYLGKSYSDYTNDWFNWFLSSNADKRNSGPVVFLKSKPLPDRATQSFNLDVSATTTTRAYDDPNGSNLYENEPNIRIGSNKLQIFEDQAVFVAIVVAYRIANTPGRKQDWGYMQDYTGLTIDNGDNPPDPQQLTINNEPINLPENLPMKEFRVTTPIFMAVVPDAIYGTSLKDFLEEGQVPPGIYPAMVSGYFVMLKFTPGSYWVHSWASAGREERGPYFSELLYQIDVGVRRAGKDPHGRLTTRRPAQFQGAAERVLKKMGEDGQLTDPEIKRVNSIQDQVDKLLKEKH